jgi:hypothetical protein
MWVYKLPQHSGKKASKYPEGIPSSSPFQKQETLQSDDTHAEKERVGRCNNNLPIIITSARNKVRIIIIDKLKPRRSSLSPSLLVQSVSHLLDPSSNSCNASFQGLEGKRRKKKISVMNMQRIYLSVGDTRMCIMLSCAEESMQSFREEEGPPQQPSSLQNTRHCCCSSAATVCKYPRASGNHGWLHG